MNEVESSKVEIINCSGYSKTLVDLPQNTDVAVGGVLMGFPVICGGNSNVKEHNECYKLSSDGSNWIKFATMTAVRSDAAAVVLPNKIWVTGGWYGKDYQALSSTELISIDGHVQAGPYLTDLVWGHTLIQVEDRIFVIGGSDNKRTYQSTTIFNAELTEVHAGPILNCARRYHGCCSVKSRNHLGRTVIILAGGRPNSTSVELLDYSQRDARWEKSKFVMKSNSQQ